MILFSNDPSPRTLNQSRFDLDDDLEAGEDSKLDALGKILFSWVYNYILVQYFFDFFFGGGGNKIKCHAPALLARDFFI